MSAERTPLAGRRIVVGVSGSIAAYKAVTLVRLLAERGAVVDVAMTAGATRFVGPLTFASLTHRPVLDDVYELDAEQQIAHIELAEAADAIVLAPATANLLGELAAGLVGNAVTAIACASRAPVIVAPAMDAGMWTHPATQRNVATLRDFGYIVVEPEVGELASGLTGIGRLAEPPTIVEAVEHLFARSGALEGLRSALQTFSTAAYGRSDTLDGTALDRAVDETRDALRALRWRRVIPSGGARDREAPLTSLATPTIDRA